MTHASVSVIKSTNLRFTLWLYAGAGLFLHSPFHNELHFKHDSYNCSDLSKLMASLVLVCYLNRAVSRCHFNYIHLYDMVLPFSFFFICNTMIRCISNFYIVIEYFFKIYLTLSLNTDSVNNNNKLV
jgi:hypothetical protein